MNTPWIDSTETAAESLNDAWAIVRSVPRINAGLMLENHGRGPNVADSLSDDLLEIASFVCGIEERVATYLRDELDIDLARQHAQAALGLPVDAV
jgi:hypothetical protein